MLRLSPTSHQNTSCLDIFGVASVADLPGFSLFDDSNLQQAACEQLRRGEAVRHEAICDFEKVKALGLYATSKAGAIHLSVSITPLGVPQEQTPAGYMALVQDIPGSQTG